ncbi:flagellar biosynthetic protein FliO [Bacillus suaedae]|uniref:Flagellar biosynthetic protein FliO n=1 Tax=Halalkalibacter suaedae TaxID=2822140 RepID=A0A940WT57_9BACI|nr:flagellar biosynthetic protein FliO [Bacillus suaedae]MBP3952025.1 flagellar biosynthetic protein FliO [Bacillus suaedae]
MQKKNIVAAIFLFLFLSVPALTVQAVPVEDSNCKTLERLNGECVETEIGNEVNVPIEPEAGEGNTEIEIVEQNTFLIFAQMIVALILVVMLIYFLLRFIGKRSQSFRSTHVLQNIGGVPLGQNRSVQLVKIGERVLVVGVGEDIQLLKEIDNEQEIAKLIEQQQQSLDQLDQPINKLFDLLTNKKKSKPVVKTKDKDSFKHLLSKQLDEVSRSQKKVHDAVRERDKS